MNVLIYHKGTLGISCIMLISYNCEIFYMIYYIISMCAMFARTEATPKTEHDKSKIIVHST